MNHRTPLLISICLLVAAALACGDSNTGSKVGTSSMTITPTKAQIYAVGDVVQVSDHIITLNSATLTGDVLKANFTIENKGAKDMTVSSVLSFSAKGSDGTKFDQQIFDCGTSLDGKVMPGDKLKGDLCWKGATKPVKIYYEANLFGSGAIVWEVK